MRQVLFYNLLCNGMIRQVVLTGVLVFLLQHAFAQSKAEMQREVDSLVRLITVSKEDTNKVWLQLRAGGYSRYTDLKKGQVYIDSALALSRRLGFRTGILKGHILKVALFRAEGNNDSSLYYNKKMVAVATQFNDTIHMGIAYMNIAESYNDFSDEEAALANAFKGLSIIERTNHDVLKRASYELVMRLYYARSEYDKALAYGEKAVAIAKRMNEPYDEAGVLVDLAQIYILTKQYDKAVAAAKRALDIAGDDRYESYAIGVLCTIALKRNDIAKAKGYAEQSLLLARKTGDRSHEAAQLKALSTCNLIGKDYTKAKAFADSSLAISKSLNDYEDINNITRVLADVAFATGNPAKGYELEWQTNEYQSTHIKQVLSKQSADLEKKYETAQKESQIKALENEQKVQQLTIQKKNTLNYILIGAAIFLMVLIVLGTTNYKQKQRLQQQRIYELETERQLTATEAVLKGEEQERTRLARDLHDGLGGMLSGIKYSLNTMKGNLIMTPDNAQAFERSLDMLDSSIKEMRRVAHNMMPEALVKFGLDTALRDFCNDINQTGALRVTYQSFGLEGEPIEQTTGIIVYRIVQELINNTIKHAGAKTAIVQLSRANGLLSITVEDDGKGFDTAVVRGATTGIGWANIKHRVDFLKGKLDVSSESGNGTSVLIELNA